MSIDDVVSLPQFLSLLKTNAGGLLVVHFWAEWSTPCKSINELLCQLAQHFPNVKFVKIEAEKVPDISENYEIVSVPTFCFFKKEAQIDKLEGANTSELAKKLSLHSEGLQPRDDLNTRLINLINSAPLMLFMKGSPDAPQCGFSRKIVDILRKENLEFKTFNILSDTEVREGLKAYSNWPTFPQFYSKGKLVGGLDIVKELSENGELTSAL